MATRKKTAPKNSKKSAAPKAAPRNAGKTRATTDEPPRTEHAHQTRTEHHTAAPDYGAFFAQMAAPFLNMAQQGASTRTDDAQKIAQSWLDTQRQQWQTMLDGMAIKPAATNAAQDMWQAFGRMPFANGPFGSGGFGSGVFGGGAGMGPGTSFADMLRGARAFDPFDQLANLPGLGYAREKHEEFARLYKAWQAHEAAQQKYNAEMARLMLEALGRFETSMVSPQPGQKPFTSLKDIYAHWVNISEDVYARFAASPAHTRLYGEVVNTLSAVKREMTVVIDQWAGQMNLPTRAEVDNLHQRLHDMKREMREMRAQLDATKAGTKTKGRT